MNQNLLWRIFKWTSGILGYILASFVISIIFSAILIFVLFRPLDDAPGTGLIWIVLFGAILTLFLVFGIFLLAEKLHSNFRIEKFRWSRLFLRLEIGILSIVGPCWIQLFWPSGPYRARFQTPAVEFLIYAASVLLFLFAVTLPWKIKARGPNATISNSGSDKNLSTTQS